MITRRTVLATSAGLAAAATLGVGTTVWRWWDRPPGEGLAVLSEDEHAFVQAVAEAWMPRGGVPELSGADAELGAFLDGVLTAMSPTNQRLLKLLTQVLDDWTLPAHLGAYRTLSLEARQTVLRGWLHHDNHLVRTAVQGLLVLIAVGWTTHPDVAPVLRPSMNCWYGR